MPTLKNSLLKIGVAASLSGFMALATGAAQTAEAQSGRIEARTDRGVAVGVAGANGGRAVRGRGCTGVEGGQACASGANVVGPEGVRAGRASVSEIGDDGAFSREAGAYALNDGGEAIRTLESQINPDGSGQRSVDGDADFANGFAARDALFMVDENGNATRSGVAAAEGDLGAVSTNGGGSYSQDGGLNYERASELAASGEAGEVYADRATAYDQETGFVFNNSSGSAFSNEDGAVQSESNTSYNREDGYTSDRYLMATNVEGGMFEADVTYNAQEGADANATCTNADGETVACLN
ncbi:MAG: hypothetical protein AAFX86_13170 [Pseudomonadota bacterium]